METKNHSKTGAHLRMVTKNLMVTVLHSEKRNHLKVVEINLLMATANLMVSVLHQAKKDHSGVVVVIVPIQENVNLTVTAIAVLPSDQRNHGNHATVNQNHGKTA